MEWSPQQLSNQWDLQWLCLRCGRSMATLNRKTRTTPKPAQSVSLLMVLDIWKVTEDKKKTLPDTTCCSQQLTSESDELAEGNWLKAQSRT